MSRRGGRPLIAALALAACGSGLAGCAASKVVVGTGPTQSPCYRVLPAASLAVRGHGRLVGVRQGDTVTLLKAVEAVRRIAVPGLLQGRTQRVCMVAFRGRFVPSRVRAAWQLGSVPAQYAVVVVRESDTKALATLLIGERPIALHRAVPVPG